MLKIRLNRLGAKKSPFYRIVVADSRKAQNGSKVAELGYYNPTVEPIELKVNVEEAKKWLSNGAQPTDREITGEARVIAWMELPEYEEEQP